MESIKLKNEKYWDAAGVYDHSKQKKQDELNEEFDQAIRNMAVANIKEIEVGDTKPIDPNVKLWIDQNAGQQIEIPTMEDFHNLKAATDEQVSAAVSNWLEENISGGETIAVDKSLTVEGAAADAKVVGELNIIARSAIAIQASQPSNVNTKVWIRSDNNGEVIAIPTMTEFEALQNRVTQLENN